jgi:hypothetical protein
MIARRRGRIVAQTPRRRLRAGKRTLRLRLNPHRWPTALAINATPVKSSSGGGGDGGGAGGGNLVST